MMQKNYLNYLISESKKFAEKYKIFDIILYGSFVKAEEEARDIDLILIFKDENLKKRTELAQNFKERISKRYKNLDIKTINIEEFFDGNFLARQAILAEGYSLVDNKPLAEKIGFKGYSLFTYNLKNLNHNEKTKFTYTLIGRKNIGIIKQLGGKSIGRGAIIIPAKNSIAFENFLQKWKINYNKKITLIFEY